MQLFATITSLIAAAAYVSAMPRPQLTKREVGGITICNGANATGPCHYEVYTLSDCHDMPEGFMANANVSTKTFAPDESGFFCWPHVGKCSDICKSPTGCTFGAVDYYNPVKNDLSTIQWDHLIQSFDCHMNQTTTAT